MSQGRDLHYMRICDYLWNGEIQKSKTMYNFDVKSNVNYAVS